MDIEAIYQRLTSPPQARAPVLDAVQIRTSPTDFEVEEIPTYFPSGVGEHLYLWIKKTELSTAELVTAVARTLRVKTRDIGVAGQKDRRAVTSQFVSVPRTAEDRIRELSSEQFQVLSVRPHGNKLRTGHLRGNRFRIVLRPTEDSRFQPGQAGLAAQALQDMARHGIPNYFGPQRFGQSSRSLQDAISSLKPTDTNKTRHGGHHKRRFAASTVQSAVFNLVLATRVESGTSGQPQPGDVVCRQDGSRPFLFDERGDTQPDQLVPMGPLPGPKMVESTGQISDIESNAVAMLTLASDDFLRSGKLTPGTRRKMTVVLQNPAARLLPDGGVELRFELPSGSYATVVLAELCSSVFTTTRSATD